MRTLAEKLRYHAGFAVGGIWFLLCSALGIVWLLVRPRNRQTLYVYGRVFCRGIVWLMGWRIEVANRDRLDSARPCVFVGNHQSFLDVVTFGSIFPKRTVSAGKREIGRIPIFGWFYRLSGNLVIDRSDPRGARGSLDEAARTIRDENVSVWFMPEGHRNSGRELLPFKTGAFRLAVAAGVPIVPIVAEPLAVIADTKRRLARPGTLRVSVLDPIPADAISGQGIAEVTALARARMQEELDRLRATGG
ncbi:MAG TPA: lysophospholipid acyltransferase family protein [Thermoanaerobaculia bacterium]|nr:lysophospholipid acyltransferase family protein [Thermoanaerobaculia bacterium]